MYKKALKSFPAKVNSYPDIPLFPAVFTPDLRCNIYPREKHLAKTAEVLLCIRNFGKLGLTAAYFFSEYHMSGESTKL